MAIISYTLGNTNGFTFGDSTKVTAGVSNSMTLGTTNSVTVGTSSSISVAGAFSASIGGSVSMSYTGALNLSYGKTLTQSTSSTTQARDTVKLAAGTLSPEAIAAWTAADLAVFNIQGALGTLALANGLLAAGAIETSSAKAATTLADFDNNKGMLASAVVTSGLTMGVNIATAVRIGIMMKTLINAMTNVGQVGTLQLDKTGAVLTSDFVVNKNTLSMGPASVSLNREVAGTSSRSLNLSSTSTTVAFEAGALDAVTSAFTPTMSSALVLSSTKSQLAAGPIAASARTGPTLSVISAPTATIMATLGDALPDNDMALGPASFVVNAGPTNQLSLSKGKSQMDAGSGASSVILDPQSASLQGGGATTLLLGVNGATINGVMIKLG